MHIAVVSTIVVAAVVSTVVVISIVVAIVTYVVVTISAVVSVVATTIGVEVVTSVIVVATHVSVVAVVHAVVASESVTNSASVRTKSVTWTYVSTYWTHSSEVVTSVVVAIVTRYTEVEVSRTREVVVHSEPPSCILEDNWTVEVVVSDETSPLVRSEEQADGSVACSEDSHVVIVVITVGDVIQIVVHCVDIIVVDHIEVVNEALRQTEGISHAVGEETCVVAHCVVAHWLCFNSYGCHNEKHCCE